MSERLDREVVAITGRRAQLPGRTGKATEIGEAALFADGGQAQV